MQIRNCTPLSEERGVHLHPCTPPSYGPGRVGYLGEMYRVPQVNKKNATTTTISTYSDTSTVVYYISVITKPLIYRIFELKRLNLGMLDLKQT